MRLRVRIVSLTVVAAASGAAPGDLLTAQQLLAALLPSVRNGRTLIGVVLGSSATGPAAGAQDAEKMLNWGFRLRAASPR
jgi:hypothetical protein